MSTTSNLATMLSAANSAALGSKTLPLVTPVSSVLLLPQYGIVAFRRCPSDKIGGRSRNGVTLSTPFAIKAESFDLAEEEESLSGELSETWLNSFSPLPLLLVAALPGGNKNEKQKKNRCVILVLVFRLRH